MTKKTDKQLIEIYKAVCNEIAESFADKQVLDFDGWIGDNVGEMADFSGAYTFALSDIILDLEKSMPQGFIIKWEEDFVDAYNDNQDVSMINYKHYIMGARFKEAK